MEAFLYRATVFVVVAVYLGLAVYIISRRPYRTISWVFGAFCLTIAGFYLMGMFLFPRPGVPPGETPLALRLKWAIISFSPAFFLHLVSFYFPQSWRRRRRFLALSYAFSLFFALHALFTDRLVAGPLMRLPGEIIGPDPGPLMRVYLLFFALQTGIGVAGLILGYRAARSPFIRRQVLYLLAPTLLIIFASIANWLIVLREDVGVFPHQIGDFFFVCAAFLFGISVLHYGSFVGHLMRERELVYSIAGTALSMVVLFMALAMDDYLMRHWQFPFHFTTTLLLVFIVGAFPVLRQKVFQIFDRYFYPQQRHRWDLVEHLKVGTQETPDPEKLLGEMLRTLCAVLGVDGGYVALAGRREGPSNGETPPFEVTAVEGNCGVQEGHRVEAPSVRSSEPVLASALSAEEVDRPGWREIGLFQFLRPSGGPAGILALKGRPGGARFTAQEMALCSVLARQIETAIRMMAVQSARDSSLQSARDQDEVLRRLEEELVASTLHTLDYLDRPQTWLEIRMLGPFQVKVNDKILPETAWETERAKALLVYLLWRGPGGATREEIFDALWPNQPTDKAANVFHVTMNRLRMALEPELRQARDSRYVLYQGGRYRFNFDAPHWLDVSQFETLAASGEAAGWQEAVRLYRGGFLEDAGLDLPPAVEVQRRALERTYQDLLEKLIDRVPEREAEVYLQKLLVVDPANEEAHYRLALLYRARGRIDLVRSQFAHWQAGLEELGLEASDRIRARWQEILQAS